MTPMEATSTNPAQPTFFEVAFAALRCVNCGELTYYDGKEGDPADLRHVALPTAAALAAGEPLNGSIFCDYRNPGSLLAERPGKEG